MGRHSRTYLFLGPLLLLLGQDVPAQPLDARILSKDGQGPITPVSLSLTLSARAGCDATGDLIPDGSRLESTDLVTYIDPEGRGVFRGSGAIVTPAGRAVLQVMIHGFVGLPAPTSDRCLDPGHLEATLDPVPTFRAATAVLEARLSADLIPDLAGPLPVYRARLDGFVTPGPELANVTIAPERPAYGVNDPIVAVVKNGRASAIQAFDLESYCTIVRLERQVGDGWELTAGCLLARLPLPTTIGEGETLSVSLPPDPGTPATKEPGVYRLALTFSPIAPSTDAAARATVVSAPFKVAPDVPPPPFAAPPLLVTDKPGFRPGEAIAAKVTNGSDATFQTHDHQSYCSILTLQRMEASGWTDVAECPLASPTLPVLIPPRTTMAVALTPGTVPAQHEPGTYRLVLTGAFLDASGQPVEPGVRVEGTPFVVYAVRTLKGDQN